MHGASFHQDGETLTITEGLDGTGTVLCYATDAFEARAIGTHRGSMGHLSVYAPQKVELADPRTLESLRVSLPGGRMTITGDLGSLVRGKLDHGRPVVARDGTLYELLAEQPFTERLLRTLKAAWRE